MKLKHKHYLAKVTFSAVTGSFYGEVIHTNYQARDSIIFLASQKQSLPTAMQQAVEQYLQASAVSIPTKTT